MLKTFNLNDSKLNYHQKIIKKIQTKLSALPEAFWKTNPILSGSYAIHLLFKPATLYDDIDVYFETEKDFLDCTKLLEEFTERTPPPTRGQIYPAKNSTTYLYDFAKIQLINKAFMPPQILIYDHDLKNVSIAIQGTDIYLDDEVFSLFYNDKISIRSTQITDGMSDKDKMIKIANLYHRVKKYSLKYDLIPDYESRIILKELLDFLEAMPRDIKESTYVDSSVYYGSYTTSQKSRSSISETIHQMKESLAHMNQIENSSLDDHESLVTDWVEF